MATPSMDISDYREYLEFFNDDSGRRPKLSRAQFFDHDEELVDLITWENIRKHPPEQRERQNLLLYLLQSAGTTYGSLSPANRLELQRAIGRKRPR
jgi:hypothetical protein